MDLSIIIVNYNVRHFLEQCLQSVERAVAGLNAEVWVVDNNSKDDSVEMVAQRFPWVRLIANEGNPGFSIANNQAIRQSAGRYVLLLNPDTVVAEDTFRRCLAFMDDHPEAGGLGARMIDGQGNFLPESKRGLPTPWVAFTKAFGLARLAPNSPRFGRYHLRFLSEHDTNPVDVLAGAFMWMRRETLDKVGLLDEDFFMYGEDIDLSYRITLGGYENYYFPEATIIHYKGESTKRGSLNYVRVFYQAMIIFARKHFAGNGARAMVWLMQLGVYLRATLTVIANVWRALRFPLLDTLGIYAGLLVLKSLWSNYHFGDPNYFPDYLNYVHFPAYVGLWVGSVFLAGGYDRPYDLGRTLRSLAVGTLLLFAVYGLLPEGLRPSRALLLLGAAWAGSWALLVRGASHLIQFGHLRFAGAADQRLLIVGHESETNRALSLLQRAGVFRNYLGRVAPPQQEGADAGAGVVEGAGQVGRSDQLLELSELYRANELIFCAADLPFEDIIRWVDKLGGQRQYRILPAGSDSIIGSHRSDRRGDVYTLDAALQLNEPRQRRLRWLLNRGLALIILLLTPVLMLRRQHAGYLSNAWAVLTGRCAWVGYAGTDTAGLPPLQPGVLSSASGLRLTEATPLRQADLLYARDYTVGLDWRIIRRHWRRLGDRPATSARA